MSTSEKRKLIDGRKTSYGNLPDTSEKQPRNEILRFNSVDAQIHLKWRRINVLMAPKKKCFGGKTPGQHILKNVTGEATPGEILAIMGASGAGKTTLLSVLTGRISSKLEVDGRVTANEKPIGKSMISLSAYVQQDDLMFPVLTVREHLTIQSLLRMSKRHTRLDREEKVEEVIKELGLTKCADNRIGSVTIGSANKGISGGEKKRLAIASELLTNPALMFLDEPTSGLDSYMAQSVISMLNDLAAKGKTVICTIHQPSSEVFNLIGRLFILAEGRVAFTGSKEQALEFFSQQNLVCPVHFNPADFYVHALAIVPGNEQQCKSTVMRICDNFESSSFNNGRDNHLEHVPQKLSEGEEAFSGRSMYKASWWTQFVTLSSRSFLSISRTPILTAVRTIQVLVIGIIIGLLYLETPYDTRGVQNINGALFLSLMQCTFPFIFPVISTFTPELGIFKREHWNGMYRTDTYFLAKNIAEVPLYVILPSLFGCVIYWMIGLNPDPKSFLIFLAVSILIGNTSVSAGYLLACMSPDEATALAITPPLVIPLSLFGGIFLNSGSIPVYFIWLKYLSWFSYGYEIMIVNQWSSIGEIDCHRQTRANVTCMTGNDIIRTLSYSQDNVPFDFAMLCVLTVVYRTIAYIALNLKSRSKV
ncbi:wht-7 (predicted) [Pycnogonum litorale]